MRGDHPRRGGPIPVARTAGRGVERLPPRPGKFGADGRRCSTWNIHRRARDGTRPPFPDHERSRPRPTGRQRSDSGVHRVHGKRRGSDVVDLTRSARGVCTVPGGTGGAIGPVGLPDGRGFQGRGILGDGLVDQGDGGRNSDVSRGHPWGPSGGGVAGGREPPPGGAVPCLRSDRPGAGRADCVVGGLIVSTCPQDRSGGGVARGIHPHGVPSHIPLVPRGPTGGPPPDPPVDSRTSADGAPRPRHAVPARPGWARTRVSRGRQPSSGRFRPASGARGLHGSTAPEPSDSGLCRNPRCSTWNIPRECLT